MTPTYAPLDADEDAAVDRPIRVLHVDDDSAFTDLVAQYLERLDDSMEVSTAHGGEEALDRLAEEAVDCVVSDYQMPGMDGLDLLESVRDDRPDLPFILFTGKGSEEIASRAISAGVTDYLQKEGGTGQYAVLANRVANAVDRDRSRDALETSQKHLSLFIDQSPLGVVQWTTDHEIVRINDAAEEIFGYAESELRGRSWQAIVPDHEAEHVREIAEQIQRDEGGYHAVTENVRKDGELVICEWHNRVVTDGDEVVAVFSQVQDVTDREEQRRRLETLISNLPGMVYRCRNAPSWPMEFVGGECESLVGYTAAELEADEVLWGGDVIHPADRTETWEVVQRAVNDREPFELTYRVVTADGKTRWVWERGRGIYTSDGALDALEGFITDVTDRKRRETELEETTTVLSTVLDHLPVGVLVEDADRNVLAANPAFCDLFGLSLSPDELVGLDCAALAEESASLFADPGFVERIETLLDRREPVDGEELRLSDGRTVERSYVPYTLPDGEANLWLYWPADDR
ncbi:MAG: PAS domain S-box protein [Haloplanus sp.]